MRNDFDFWKNTCQVKYGVFRHLVQYNFSIFSALHAYIIDHYNLSVRIIGLAPHTTNVVCVNFIHKWRDLQFKVDSEKQIFFLRNFSLQFLFTLRVFARNLLRGNRRRKTVRIPFWCQADTLPTRPRRLPLTYMYILLG